MALAFLYHSKSNVSVKQYWEIWRLLKNQKGLKHTTCIANSLDCGYTQHGNYSKYLFIGPKIRVRD
jgi:hypothetical protein